ncbi:MAG: hypothetical protein U0M41_03390 [Negativibacillus sp.]|nr:hypothetical protein [Negativibacillus sp.]
MKKVQFTAALLALMLALGGCSGTTVGESQSAQSSQSITVGESQEEQDEQVLSAERIPTELEGEGVFVDRWQDWDRETLPSQYLTEVDDTLLRLVEQVQKVSADAEPADLFDGIEHAGTSRLLRVALEKTPAIDLQFQMTRDSEGNLQAESDSYPDHVLTALLQNEQEEGRDLREFYYQEDVAAVYSHLFGSGRALSFQDQCPSYYYYAREGVFAHKGDRIQTQVWPMVVCYDDGETTATVDLLLTEIQGSDKPLLYRKAEGGTVELTASNYQQELEGEPVYRYTFQKQGEQLILSGIRQVGVLAEGAAGVDDAALPLEEQGPQLQTPERVMISSEDMQHQLDLQKEYEESTAVEYLMELLGQAQQVSSAAASQVLAGNGSRTLTMTLGYTEGQEVVLNVMSQGYLPGVEESYMTFSLGSKQFVLPQESYADFTNCINTCRLAQ